MERRFSIPEIVAIKRIPPTGPVTPRTAHWLGKNYSYLQLMQCDPGPGTAGLVATCIFTLARVLDDRQVRRKLTPPEVRVRLLFGSLKNCV